MQKTSVEAELAEQDTKDWAVQQTFNCDGSVGQLTRLGFVANSGTGTHFSIGDQLTTLKYTRCHMFNRK
jgi:hypothetical protein